MSRMSYVPGANSQNPGYEDIKGYLKILRYFFAEATTGDLRKTELYNKLEDQMNMIFDCITRSWRILSRKEDLFQEVTKALVNFGSNKSINSLCYTRLTDTKSPILAEVTNTINKFESADKNLLRISFEFLRDMSHGKEVRLFLHRNKTLENCVTKLNKSKVFFEIFPINQLSSLEFTKRMDITKSIDNIYHRTILINVILERFQRKDLD